MQKRRKNASGVYTRKIPDDCIVRNVYGEYELAKQYCDACQQLKYKFEYYLESRSKRKHANQTRSQCVECWDIYKGCTDYSHTYYELLKLVKEMNNA
jgi:hypothetical protein